jgi:hypothetical protein
MFDVAQSLERGLDAAQIRLRDAQVAVADANAGHGGRSTDAAMARTAQAAIFNEALLNAVHERLSELKMVTR